MVVPPRPSDRSLTLAVLIGDVTCSLPLHGCRTASIPTMSDWSVVDITLLLLTAGTPVYARCSGGGVNAT